MLIRFELMAVVRYRSSDYHCCLLQETIQFDNIRLALAVRALSRVAVDQHEQYSHHQHCSREEEEEEEEEAIMCQNRSSELWLGGLF